MDQTANIAKSLKTLFKAYGPLTDDVPGGMLYKLQKAGTVYPYASLSITLGETQYNAGQIYVQNYHVNIKVWANQQVQTASQIQTDLDQCFNQAVQLAALPTNVRLLQVTLDTGDVDEDPERNTLNLIMIAHTNLILTLQEQRP